MPTLPTGHTARAAITLLAVAGALAQPSSSGPLAPPANGPARRDPAWIAITDCTVHDPQLLQGQAASINTIEHATVVLRDGKIQAILPGEKFVVEDGPDKGKERLRAARTPLGPRIVIGEGLHVYPAFIDSYVEIDVPAPAAGPSRHFLSRVTPERLASDAPGAIAPLAESLRAQGFAAAAFAPKGGIFRGQSAIVSLAKASDDVSAAKPPVYRDRVYHSAALERGSDYPDSEMGAIAVLRQVLGDAAWQAGARVRAEFTEGPNALDAVAPGSSPASPFFLFDTTSDLQLLRAAKIAAEFQRPAVFLGSGIEYQRLDAIKSALADNAPVHAPRLILPVQFPKTPDLSTPGRQESTDLRDLMAWEQAPTNPRRLFKAGVPFALTTAKLRERAEFLANVRKIVKYGLPKEEALASLTLRPASLLGVADQLGSLAVGKRANLLVATGDVFARKDTKGKDVKVRSVWIDGREHEITPPPHKPLEGEWTIAFAEKDPNVPADAPAPKLSFDADNALTVKSPKKSPPKQAEKQADKPADKPAEKPAETAPDKAADKSDEKADDKPDEKPDEKPDDKIYDSTKATRLQYDGARISYTLDTRTPDDEGIGVVTVAGVVNWLADPPVYVGTIFTRDGHRFDFRASREPAKPKSAIVGKWRVIEEDANPRDPDAAEGLTLEFTDKRLTLTFTRKPAAGPSVAPSEEPATDKPSPPKPAIEKIVITSRDLKLSPPEISPPSATFTHDLKKLGLEGKSSDTVRIENDTLIGEATLPDKSKHTYKAKRLPDTKPDDDDDEALKDIPEQLAVPFGPYGLAAYPAPKTTVLTNATLWTSTSKAIIPNGHIILRDGKIAAIGAGAAPELPQAERDSAEVIDLAGKHIAPGIIDCHSHTGVSGSVNEGAQAVTAEVRIQDVTDPNSISWYRQLAGGVTAVNTLHGSANAIGGQSQTNKNRWGCPAADDMHFAGAAPGIKFALGENPTNKNGGPADTYPQTRMGVEMLIRDRFTAAREYANALSVNPNTRRDLELEPLAEVLAGRRLVHCHSYRQDEILMLCHVAREFGFKIGPFQHILEGYKVADAVRDYSGGGSAFADWWAYKIEVQDAIPQGPPLMHKVGAVVSFNSDSDEMARRMNVEAAKAVKYGDLSETEALNFVTINPAKQLMIDQFTGSLEVGKDADISVWSGSPLSTLSRCEMTFVDGRKLFSLDQDAQHRKNIRAERSRLIQKVLTDAKKKKSKDSPDKSDEKSADKSEGRPDAPPGAPPVRRRMIDGQRPPSMQGDSTESLRLDSLSDEDLALERYYRDLYNRGYDPSMHLPGVCGCYAR